ncbi:hypothetical protein D3C83_140500 [compost metagenome]
MVERNAVELASALARDAMTATDLLQRVGAGAGELVPLVNDVALAWRKSRERGHGLVAIATLQNVLQGGQRAVIAQ